MNLVSTIWKDERGQDLIEYALMAGFVAVAAGAVVPDIGAKIGKIFSTVGAKLDAAGGA
jgi:pilus assembly protein Flp/PilA